MVELLSNLVDIVYIIWGGEVWFGFVCLMLRKKLTGKFIMICKTQGYLKLFGGLTQP